ncbi:MAG TPA: hypothetical protein VET24_16845 [Actinomycetota bacterium]|nr:hypothetical protein [Actinomycetota bacterium]
MTIEAFAEHLGVAGRIAKWEAQGQKIVPTPGIQKVLDASLERFRGNCAVLLRKPEDAIPVLEWRGTPVPIL